VQVFIIVMIIFKHVLGNRMHSRKSGTGDFKLSNEFYKGFATILDITPVHSSSETLDEKTLTRAVVAPLFVGRIGSADHGTGRTAERRELSLAHLDRRIRSAAGVGGWQPALLCALVELQVRLVKWRRHTVILQAPRDR
jgi:hypothetical protein